MLSGSRGYTMQVLKGSVGGGAVGERGCLGGVRLLRVIQQVVRQCWTAAGAAGVHRDVRGRTGRD
jgi:hypothetical protein